MNAYDRLLAEALPTGTFGHAAPAVPRVLERPSRWSPEEQAAHVTALEAELDRLEGRGTGKPRLRVIEGEAA
ncbi:hypothetical protein ACIRF8_15190 [Streptomyces sp. NPDC102406]|uniref:hypothetical protein n=1 Tax=Streptomyces sp. NPDC102406 TaxID=3366171 RepID=UPI0038067F0B